MIAQNKVTSVIQPLFLALLIFLSGCSAQGKTTQPKNQSGPAAKPDTQEPQNTAEPTAAPSPTIVYKEGAANITILRVLEAQSSNSGVLSHNTEGTVPVTIRYNQDKNVWEVKGSSDRGVGRTEFINPECNCLANWTIEFTVSGVLVPMGGLIAEPDDGCYVQITINEDWERFDATCNCSMGSAIAELEPEQLYFGPMKMYLVEGFEINEMETMANTSWIYRWLIKDFDVPVATGCVAGDPID